MNRATVNKIFQKHPVYVKAGMIAVISIIIFGCVYSKDNGKKLEKDEKGREILRRNESGKDELKNMKVKIDEKHSGNIQLINNSDKGSGNTLQSSSQGYREKSKVHSI